MTKIAKSVTCCGKNPIVTSEHDNEYSWGYRYKCEVCGCEGGFGMSKPRGIK